MSNKYLQNPPIFLETANNPDSSLIWLHGLGADGHDFESIVPELNLPEQLRLRFIFPNAPQMPVSINNGFIMPAWYDLVSMELNQEPDIQGILESSKYLKSLVESEIQQGIDPKRIILAGFSQGGVIALDAFLSNSQRLGGLFALSTYLVEIDPKPRYIQSYDSPILQLHGSFDPVVPLGLAKTSHSQLKLLGYNPQWHDYPMPHSVCPPEIQLISQWIQKILL
jgi:phospholipase/carboxylesterase